MRASFVGRRIIAEETPERAFFVFRFDKIGRVSHNARRARIRFSMDYSAYFLKNLDKDSAAKKYRNEDYKRYRQERENPYDEGVILQPPIPKDYSPSTYEYRAMPVLEMENEYGKSILPPAAKERIRRGKRWSVPRKIALCVCLFLVVTASTFVACDFLTQGGVIGALADMAEATKIQKTYYFLASAEFDTLTDARAYSAALRLQGGAGYVAKRGDTYYVYAEMYDNRQTAEAVSQKNKDSRLIELNVKNANLKRFDQKFRAALEGFLDYGPVLCEEMIQIADALQSGTTTVQAAKEKVNALKDGLDQDIKQLNVFVDQMAGDDAQTIIDDMRAALGLLDNLTNDELSRPNFLCDVRYYRIQIALNYAELCRKLSD